MFPLGFLDLIISRTLTFLYTLLSVGDIPERLRTIHTYHGNSKKRFHRNDNTKNSIKNMGISSLLNIDLGNLNGLSLILQNDCLSMYNAIYIFLKFTCPIGKKTKTYFLIKTIKAFFQNQRFG